MMTQFIMGKLMLLHVHIHNKIFWLFCQHLNKERSHLSFCP